MSKDPVTIVYALEDLEEDGKHMHNRGCGEGWVFKCNHADYKTHISITEDEIEQGIVRARREARIAVARLKNFEKLNYELCKQRIARATEGLP